MTMRHFALGLLILIAAPTIALGDAEDELECKMLVGGGYRCVEYVWRGDGGIEKGRFCPTEPWSATSSARRPIASCTCNRKAYQDFGFGERTKYYWCKARYGITERSWIE